MRFKIKTPVNQTARKVMDGFDESLFLALKPPLMPLKLLRFDGSKKGDRVQIRLGVPPLSQKWDALIVEHGENEEEIYFIDIGEKLPFPLKKWKHRHRINKKAEGSIIIDDIEYHTPFILLDYMMLPIMYLQFYIRKPVYRRVFS